MSDEVEELVGRLVVGRKRDGRKVFDEGVKAELVALCARSGASVSKLARECDLNANQLSRWIRSMSKDASVRSLQGRWQRARRSSSCRSCQRPQAAALRNHPAR